MGIQMTIEFRAKRYDFGWHFQLNTEQNFDGYSVESLFQAFSIQILSVVHKIC